MNTKLSMGRLLIVSLLLLTAVPFTAKSQERVLQLDINYAIGIPAGSFRSDLVDKTSSRGWTANIMYNTTNKLSVGLGFGFQDFYQKFPRAVYKLEEGGEVSAVLTNSIQTIPVLAQAQYRFLPGKAVQPYVGLGLGGNIIVYDQWLGEFENR